MRFLFHRLLMSAESIFFSPIQAGKHFLKSLLHIGCSLSVQFSQHGMVMPSTPTPCITWSNEPEPAWLSVMGIPVNVESLSKYDLLPLARVELQEQKRGYWLSWFTVSNNVITEIQKALDRWKSRAKSASESKQQCAGFASESKISNQSAKMLDVDLAGFEGDFTDHIANCASEVTCTIGKRGGRHRASLSH